MNISIFRKQNKRLSKNFESKEFFDSKFTSPIEAGTVPAAIIGALQYIRDEYNIPIIITSWYRSNEYELSRNRKPPNAHTQMIAVDWQFVKTAEGVRAQYDVEKKLYDYAERGIHSALADSIREIGVTGIGVYLGRVHFDSREWGLNQKDAHGDYVFWSSSDSDYLSETSWKMASPRELEDSPDDPPLGGLWLKKIKRYGFLLAVFVVLCYYLSGKKLN